jgi:hypothetical protein
MTDFNEVARRIEEHRSLFKKRNPFELLALTIWNGLTSKASNEKPHAPSSVQRATTTAPKPKQG